MSVFSSRNRGLAHFARAHQEHERRSGHRHVRRSGARPQGRTGGGAAYNSDGCTLFVYISGSRAAHFADAYDTRLAFRYPSVDQCAGSVARRRRVADGRQRASVHLSDGQSVTPQTGERRAA